MSYDGTISHDISLLSSDDSGTYKRMDEDRMKKIHILDMTFIITVLKLYDLAPTGIAEVTGSNPVEAQTFFSGFFFPIA